MRKVYLFCALLAGVALMTGCQKEQDGVTLKAVINQESKAYIGSIEDVGLFPFWDTDDKVRINGTQYGFQENSVDQTYATIAGVQGSAPYYAIYPSLRVRTMDITNGSADVTIPVTQFYETVSGHQRLEMLMAAKTEGTVLQFDNLCAILKVHVANNIWNVPTFDVQRIVVTVDGANITGPANYNFNTNTLQMEGTTEDKDYVILSGGNSPMATLTTNAGQDFYLFMAPFSNKHVTVRMETQDKHYQVQIENATALASHMASINLNVNNLYGNNTDAFLKPGPEVNEILSDLIENSGVTGSMSIVFNRVNTSAPPAGAPRVDLGEGLSTPVYAFISTSGEGTTLQIQTGATYLYFNADCSHMFEDLPHVAGVSFDSYTITDNVTDMRYMFANNTTLKVNGFWALHTTHVTTMAHMFENNTAQTQFDLSTFDTRSLTGDGMEGMFNGCTGASSINLSHFTTSGVTSMKDLFKNCLSVHFIYLNNFDMSNVSDANKAGMCTNLANGCTVTNPCIIESPSTVHTAITAQDASGNYYSGLVNSPTGNFDGAGAAGTSKVRFTDVLSK